MNSLQPYDEIDRRDVAIALRRRWILAAGSGSGLLGIVIVEISIVIMPVEKPLKTMKMVVDTYQGPYARAQRRLQMLGQLKGMGFSPAALTSALKVLMRLASDEFASAEVLPVKVQPLMNGSIDGNNFLASNG